MHGCVASRAGFSFVMLLAQGLRAVAEKVKAIPNTICLIFKNT